MASPPCFLHTQSRSTHGKAAYSPEVAYPHGSEKLRWHSGTRVSTLHTDRIGSGEYTVKSNLATHASSSSCSRSVRRHRVKRKAGKHLGAEVHSPDSMSASTAPPAAHQSEDLEAVLLPAQSRQLSLEAALEEIGKSPAGGTGHFQRRMVFICGAGWLADNAWLNCVILIEAQVQSEFGLSNSQTTFLLTILFIGEIVGSSFWGPLSDRFGRKPAFMGSLAIAGTVGLAAAFAPSYRVLLALLFTVGTGVGGNLPVDGALFAELVPGSQRGLLLTILSVFWSLGNFISSLLAWVLIPSHSCGTEQDFSMCSTWDNAGWRLVIGVLAVLNLITLCVRINMPESPAFLLQAGRVADANAVMAGMAAENGHWWEATLVCDKKQQTALEPTEGNAAVRALRQLKQVSLSMLYIYPLQSLHA